MSWLTSLFSTPEVPLEQRMSAILSSIAVEDPYGTLAESLVRVGIRTETDLNTASLKMLLAAGASKPQCYRIILSERKLRDANHN